MNFRLGWGPKIALQFATVMLPLAVLLFVQAWLDLRRSDRLAEAFPLHLHANAARKSYKQFVDGVTDAVDSGKLSAKAVEALHKSADSLHQIADSPSGRDALALDTDLAQMGCAGLKLAGHLREIGIQRPRRTCAGYRSRADGRQA